MHLQTTTPPALLRAEVAALRQREQRRVFPATVVLGASAATRRQFVLPWPPRTLPDLGLLFDVVDGLHDAWEQGGGRYDTWAGGTSPRLWLVRPGTPEVHDLDLRVATVARRVAAARGVDEPEATVVLTRYGWLDPLTGEARSWKRLRVRAPGG